VLSAGSIYNGGRKGDSLWLFSLDGTIESLPPEAGATATGAGAAAAVPPAMQAVSLPAGQADLAAGATLYRQLCQACHGDRGQGGQGVGAPLEAVGRNAQAVANVAWNGRTPNMPSFRGTLTLEQLRDVAHYVSQRLFATGHTD
jgi:mono/diheme cytochrome c family protein